MLGGYYIYKPEAHPFAVLYFYGSLTNVKTQPILDEGYTLNAYGVKFVDKNKKFVDKFKKR